MIFFFEVIVCIIFAFFYMGVWTTESVMFSTLSAKFFNTGCVALVHASIGIGGAILINTVKE